MNSNTSSAVKMRSKKPVGSSNMSTQQSIPQYKILSRPASSDTIVSNNMTDLSEFAVAPRHPETLPLAVGTQTIPITPPRPASTQSLLTRQHQNENFTTQSTRQRSAGKSKARSPAVSSSPKQRTTSGTPQSKPNGTPRSTSHSKPQTPARTSSTPSHAYAGPTFHASPAASALPTPKIFSKSVPEQKKGSCLKTMMDGEADEAPVDQSDGSPTLRRSRLDQVEQVRDLEFLFNAHRAEKAREQKESAIRVAVDGFEAAAGSPKIDNSPSIQGGRGPSSRHIANGSHGGLFSMDLEDLARSVKPLQHEIFQSQSLCNVSNPALSTSGAETQVAQEEHRKAKALKLKNLLRSAEPQSPIPASPKLRATVSDSHVPRAFQSPCNLSGFSTAVCSLNTSPANQEYTPSPESLGVEKSTHLSSSSKQPSLARPSSFNVLSQATDATILKKNTLPKVSANTAYLQKKPYHLQSHQPNHRIVQPKASNLPYKPNLPSQNSFPGIDNRSIGDSTYFKSMEDYLRGVLKLDTLNSDGTNGVTI
ncbi:hypothetical protein MMC31_003902 [Peltigera leucophlebia]|nr:hypothetical protein [Peltigera leucophlebia]